MTLLNFQPAEWGNPQCYLGSWLMYTKSEFNQLEVNGLGHFDETLWRSV